MADFNITVDTSEMARSIDSVKGHVDGVTGAVTAMETAVIIAQDQASKHICQNVDNGFYMLMRSQLSQKIAAVSSEMFSRQQLMETFKKEIDKIMLIMTDDYRRIHDRYERHFNSLNKALDTRIHELDKRAYEISKNYKSSQFKVGNDVLKTIAYNDDTERLNVQSVSATVKNKSARAINVMKDDVIESVTYEKSVSHILKDEAVTEATEHYIPVLIAETDSVVTTNTSVSNIYVPQNDNIPKSDVVNQVQSNAANFAWGFVDQICFDSVKNSFMRKCTEAGIEDRVLQEMVRLLDATKWEVTTGQTIPDAGNSEPENPAGEEA